MEEERGSLSREQKARAIDDVVVDFPCEVAGIQRGQQVRNDTGKTKVKSFLGDLVEGEGLLDDFLYRNCLACYSPK